MVTRYVAGQQIGSAPSQSREVRAVELRLCRSSADFDDQVADLITIEVASNEVSIVLAPIARQLISRSGESGGTNEGKRLVSAWKTFASMAVRSIRSLLG